MNKKHLLSCKLSILYRFIPFFCLLLVLYMKYKNIELSEGFITTNALFAIALILVIISTVQYTVYEDRLAIRILGVSIRNIPWAHINDIYMFSQNELHGRVQGISFFLVQIGTLGNAEITAENVLQYATLHPWKFVRFDFSAGKEDIYIEAMQKYAGIAVHSNQKNGGEI